MTCKTPQFFALFSATIVLFPSVFVPPAQARFGFEPPKGQPAPAVTVGGGRRGGSLCQKAPGLSSAPPLVKSLANSLTPLVPVSKLGLTVSDRPTFLVYVPQSAAKAVEFTLEDQAGNGLYQTRVAVTNAASIVSITLPATGPLLALGKDYKWSASVICKSPKPGDPFVEGVVRRIQPDARLKNQLAATKGLDRVALLAKSGIWHDTLADLITLRQSQPNNTQYTVAWQDLLKSADLDAIAAAPIRASK
ncbi:DUF928 domain-containing protein [Phormidesmis sp. 146-12]